MRPSQTNLQGILGDKKREEERGRDNDNDLTLKLRVLRFWKGSDAVVCFM